MPIWDDHEVDNNYAGTADSNGNGGEDFTARRAAAYQAWYEHLPVRMAPPTGDSLPIHRSATIGDLAELLLLDGRQYRDPEPCEGSAGVYCDEVSEDREFLGVEQEAWLDGRLAAVKPCWVLLASDVVMAPMDFGQVFVNPDQWDGYPMARQRLLDTLADHGHTDVVVFSGDIHAGGVTVVPSDPFDLSSPAALSELVVPAISSGIDEKLGALGGLLANQPHISWWDFDSKGWLLVELGRDRLVARFRVAEDATDPDSPVSETQTWSVARGTPGAVEGA